MKTLLCLTVACVLLGSGPADALNISYTASPDVSHRQVVYKKTADRNGQPVTLKMHVFEAAHRDRKQPVPAIVFFFGGGWVGGSPSQFFHHCDYLARRGMIACAAEYRIRSKHQTSPVQCVEDGKSAVRWLRAHATELGIDPHRIAAGGGSAGGHVAAATATLPEFDNPDEDKSISSRPDALCLFNPAIDTTKTGWNAKTASAATDGQPQRLSPAHHVVAGLPATIIFHGTADHTVPFENVQRFTRLMKQAGNRCELVPYEGKDHAFFNYGRSPDNAIYKDTVKKMDDFFVSLGWLKKPAS